MQPETLRRVPPLDAIRFVAASWVVLGHFGLWQVLRQAHSGDPLVAALASGAGLLVSGPAAVIVFFVISGFCIHHPYARGESFDAPSFYVRRFVRIGIPLGVAILIAPAFGMPLQLLDRMAIWSLVCELAYYASYPAIRLALRHVGPAKLVALSFGVALAVVLSDVQSASRDFAHSEWGNYPSFGIAGNGLLGLPCWLLGVCLAERRPARSSHRPSIPIGWWRAGIWALSCVLLVLRFHSPLGYPWTLDLFAIAVAFWLRAEIQRHADRKPWRWMESAGAWSYSLYLVHPLAEPAFRASMTPGNASILHWALCIASIYVGAYAFYRLVERPSHALARRLASRVPKRAAASAAAP